MVLKCPGMTLARARQTAVEVIWLAVAIGGLAGILEATVHPQGWLWTAARALNAAVFVVALVVWLLALRQERRARRTA